MLIASDKSNSREDQKQQACEEIGSAWECSAVTGAKGSVP
jgi:hypothetical protein